MLNLVWLVPVLPLIGFLLNFILGRMLKLSERAVYLIGCGTVLLSLIITLGAFAQYAFSYAPANGHEPFVAHYFTWLQAAWPITRSGNKPGHCQDSTSNGVTR